MRPAAPREGLRRVIHLASGSLGIIALASPIPHRTMTILLAALAVLAVLLEVIRHRSPPLERVLEILSFGVMRAGERAGTVLGATMLAIGYLAAWLLFPGAAAAPAMLVTAAADPAAALAGTTLARERGRKTAVGSAAAALVALLVLLVTTRELLPSIAGAVFATLAERLPGPGVDNLAMPLATAGALVLLR